MEQAGGCAGNAGGGIIHGVGDWTGDGGFVQDRTGNEKTEPEDLTDGMIERSRKRMRLNALILVAVFLFTSIAPPPWNLLAPLLFLIPLTLALAGRLRRGPVPSQPEGDGARQAEPYSSTPRHPGDPRHYRPIE